MSMPHLGYFEAVGADAKDGLLNGAWCSTEAELWAWCSRDGDLILILTLLRYPPTYWDMRKPILGILF
ncbi:Unannotated [Lentimonas sp. CC19]|nr:Unannotated [Lentimonas sp. CC4]CAA6686691.1 Unannotated [Lentimonas sp. CC6]CAA6692957.1 Unannotated [Lentimonas sp. CC10]CAA6695619.1 Unannotated [Lentimonas sp. CC19]CAA7069947.1 Unannotated [Lentimonas sp. CC11]CAA7168109.1 Unannotated [Lentimonas sp. CC21]CAA7181743.1 Unannotated [Lentimonas sp. CC8]